MHTLKNLILPFKKYKVAAILNIIGLSVAFASFTIITTQVKYDFSFDRHYKNKDRIFRLETRSFDGNVHNAVVSRPMAKPLGSIPEVERQGLFTGGPELAVYDKMPEKTRSKALSASIPPSPARWTYWNSNTSGEMRNVFANRTRY